MKFTIMQTPHMSYRIECNKEEFLDKYFSGSKLKTFLDTVCGVVRTQIVTFTSLGKLMEKLLMTSKIFLKLNFL